jgi:hypothetical protein
MSPRFKVRNEANHLIASDPDGRKELATTLTRCTGEG